MTNHLTAASLREPFSRRLRRLRAARNLTRMDLARKIGVTDRVVGYWESDERTPTPANLEALADLFSLTMDEVWRGQAVDVPLRRAG